MPCRETNYVFTKKYLMKPSLFLITLPDIIYRPTVKCNF